MGRPKALLVWKGETFVARLLRLFAEAGCASVTVVVGAHADLIGSQLPIGTRVIHHNGWAKGMRSSLRAGVEPLPAGPVLLTHVDRPLVDPVTLLTLLSGAIERPRVPYFEGQPGHPVVLPQSLRPRLLAPDDASLREILAVAHTEPISVTDPGVLVNINSPEDFDRLARSRA
jgi:molybdenum cofactor cytidylyltransferase